MDALGDAEALGSRLKSPTGTYMCANAACRCRRVRADFVPQWLVVCDARARGLVCLSGVRGRGRDVGKG